ADSNPLLPARAAGPDPWHRRPPRSGGHSPRYYRKRERNGGSVGALLALRVGTRNKRGRLRRPITRPRPGIEPTPDGEVSIKRGIVLVRATIRRREGSGPARAALSTALAHTGPRADRGRPSAPRPTVAHRVRNSGCVRWWRKRRGCLRSRRG